MVSVGGQCIDHHLFPAGALAIGYRFDLFIQDPPGRFIRGFELVPSHNPATFVPVPVKDQHPVASEFLADLRSGGIDSTGKPTPGQAFVHERAAFFGFAIV